MTPDDRDEALDRALEPFFASAREETAEERVSEDLMARILAEAAAEQPAATEGMAPVPPQVPAPRAVGLGTFFATLGGWPAAAGLAAVTGLGVLVGYSPPDLLSPAFEAAPLLGLSSETSPASMLAGFDSAFLSED